MITVFIYHYNLVFSLLRSFTDRKELKRQGITKFATNYLTQRSIQDFKKNLKTVLKE